MSIENLHNQLEKIAYDKTTPFCYSCYIEAPAGICPKCSSDDLMLSLKNYGVEYHTDWVIEALINESLTEIDQEEVFTEMLSDCYPETTTVGFLELDTVTVMKDQDPIAFSIAQSEYFDSFIQNEQVITFDNGNKYFWIHDVEQYISENEVSEVA